MLVPLPQVLTQEQCRTILDKLNHAGSAWVDGRVTAGYQGVQVKNNQQIDESSPLARELGDAILIMLEQNPLFISAVLPHIIYPPMFNRYEKDMQFGYHIDGAIRLLPNTNIKMRTDVSITLFLNAPETYDGGELLIDDVYGTQSVKLPAGDMIVYPATSLHCINPVTRGVRIASFFWAQSMVADNTERALLFDLDTAIQRLNTSNADHHARLQFTGCYHNLLRKWATP